MSYTLWEGVPRTNENENGKNCRGTLEYINEIIEDTKCKTYKNMKHLAEDRSGELLLIIFSVTILTLNIISKFKL